jgi:hypothetical protein
MLGQLEPAVADGRPAEQRPLDGGAAGVGADRVRRETRGAGSGVSGCRSGAGEEVAGRQPGVRGAARTERVCAGCAQPRGAPCVPLERAAAPCEERVPAASDPARLVRHDAGEVAVAHRGARSALRRSAPGAKLPEPARGRDAGWAVMARSVHQQDELEVGGRPRHAAAGGCGLGVSHLRAGLGRGLAHRGRRGAGRRGTLAAGPVDDRRGPYAWLLWSFTTTDLASGAHTLVSRAIDAEGVVQPTQEERRARLASGREDNAQWSRAIHVS